MYLYYLLLLIFFFGPGNFKFDHASPNGEMLLTVVLLRGRDFLEIEPFKGICHNNMYTVVGCTINQINFDDNGAYGYKKKCEKGLLCSKGNGKLILNTVYKEGNQYVQHVRNGPSHDILLVEPSKVYTIERYYRRNKTFLVEGTWL